VTKWKNLRRETGGVSPGKIGGHKKPVLSGANADWLRKRVRSGPFTLRKLTKELAARGIKTDVRAVWTFVHAEGLSFKKNDPASRTKPPRYRP
jgi:transposase